jgi:hypothetical protein
MARMTQKLISWWTGAAEGARLAFEAQQVIAMRMRKISAGGAAARTEATRMMTEKVAAAAEAAAILTMGGSARKVLRRYRTHVRANLQRLNKSGR